MNWSVDLCTLCILAGHAKRGGMETNEVQMEGSNRQQF